MMDIQDYKLVDQHRVREQVKEVACHLFNTKGFNETALLNITSALNFSLETFQIHFQSKDDLVEAIWSE